MPYESQFVEFILHQKRPFLLFLHKCIHANICWVVGHCISIFVCWLLFMFNDIFWCLSIRAQVQVVVYPLAWLTRFAALSPVHNSIVEYTFAAMLNCLSCAHSHFDFKVNQSAYSCYLHAGHVGKVRLPDIARFSRWNPRLFGQCLLNWTKCCRKPSNCAKRNHGTKQDMGSCKMSLLPIHWLLGFSSHSVSG